MLLTLLVLTAAPNSASVVVTRRTSVTAVEALALADDTAKALEKAGVHVEPDPVTSARDLALKGVKDTSTCQGKKACVLDFGKKLGVEVLVSLSVSQIEGDRSVALEAWRVPGATIIAKKAVLFPAAKLIDPAVLDEFANLVRVALGLPAPMAKPVAVDAPVVAVAPKLTPAEVPTTTLPLTVPPPARSHVASYVVGGAAVAALAAAGALGITGFLAKNRLDATTGANRSPLTMTEAQALAGSANTQLTAAGVAAIVGAGLGATAVILW